MRGLSVMALMCRLERRERNISLEIGRFLEA